MSATDPKEQGSRGRSLPKLGMFITGVILVASACQSTDSTGGVAVGDDAQPAVSSRQFECPSRLPPSVTTDIGSEEVRAEIDRLVVDIACRLQTLESRVAEWRGDQDEIKRNKAQEASIAEEKFQECISANGLSESQWNDLDIASPSTPCTTEYFRIPIYIAPPSQNPGSSGPLYEYQNTWLTAIVELGTLAELYPDSVQPSALPGILNNSRSARDCLDQRI
ncbi:MAG: hypothetical protein RLZ37_1705, partial [Actinomycetota bacterium]